MSEISKSKIKKSRAILLTISEWSTLQKNSVLKIDPKRLSVWKTTKGKSNEKCICDLLKNVPDVGLSSESYVLITFSTYNDIPKEPFYIDFRNITKYPLTARAKELLSFSEEPYFGSDNFEQLWEQEKNKRNNEINNYKALFFIQSLNNIFKRNLDNLEQEDKDYWEKLQNLSIETIKRTITEKKFFKVAKQSEKYEKTKAYSIRMARWFFSQQFLENEQLPETIKKDLFSASIKEQLDRIPMEVCNLDSGAISSEPIVTELSKIDKKIKKNTNSSLRHTFLYFVILFHYIHLSEQQLPFNNESLKSDLITLASVNEEEALESAFIIGKSMTGHQMIALRLASPMN